MPNPTFRSGPISFPAKADLSKFRLVTIDESGAAHAAATGAVFGAVTAAASAAPATNTADNVLHIGSPNLAAVHIGPATVPLEVDGDATAIKQGAPVYSAADGKVSASGTVLVGFAARTGTGSTVKTTLMTPVAGA